MKKNSPYSSSIDSSGRKRRREHDNDPKDSLVYSSKAKGAKVSYSGYEAPATVTGKSSKSMVSGGSCYTKAQLKSMATSPPHEMTASDSLSDLINELIDSEEVQDRFSRATESLYRQLTGETRTPRGLGGFVWSMFAAPIAAINGDDVGAVETAVDGIAGVAGPIIGGVIMGPVGAIVGAVISNTLGGFVTGFVNWFCRRNVRYEVHIFNLSSRDIEFVSNVAFDCGTANNLFW